MERQDAEGLGASAAAAEAMAAAIAQRAEDGAKGRVGDAAYSVEMVTWPVSQDPDGASAFASPLPAPALIRNDVVLVDVRADYTDGRSPYPVVGTKLGRYRRFRVGSPGDRGYDLRLRTEEDLAAFAAEAREAAQVLGVSLEGSASEG